MRRFTKLVILNLVLLFTLTTRPIRKIDNKKQPSITNIKPKPIYHTVAVFVKAAICIKSLKNCHNSYKIIENLKQKGWPTNKEKYYEFANNYFDLSVFLFLAYISGKSSYDSFAKVLHSTYYHEKE